MIFRPARWVVAFAATLTMMPSCSSASGAGSSPTPAGAPSQNSVPADRSPTPTSPDPAPANDCVAPGAVLQDQDADDHQFPWKRSGAARVVITFETKNVGPDWVAEMQKGVTAWNRSPCLETRLVQTCQPNTNCVTVNVLDSEDDGNFDAVESGGFTIGGHIDLQQALTGGERTNVTIHEMGHAVGLSHRVTEGVLMNGDTYDNVFDPDATDLQNLLVLYGGQEN